MNICYIGHTPTRAYNAHLIKHESLNRRRGELLSEREAAVKLGRDGDSNLYGRPM